MRVDFPVVSFIGALIVLIPLPLHWRTGNIAIVSLVVWLFLCNVTRGVNSIIWGDNVVVKYRVWCDITTKIIIGANIGLLSSALCICRQLAQVSSPSYVIPTAKVRRRRMIFDLGICVGFPLIDMALHYVVQGHRFDIIEEFGCTPNMYVSIPALFIISIPPLVLALVAAVYGAIALRWFILRRDQFRTVLRTSRSGITWDRWVRLISLSVVEITFATGLSLYVLVANIQVGVSPWTSWDDVHADWNFVPVYPKILLPELVITQQVVLWYFTIPLCSLSLFLFFGTSKEVLLEYEQIYTWIKTHIFRIRCKQAPVLPLSDQDTVSAHESAKGAPGIEPETDTAEVKESKHTSPSIYTDPRASLPSLHEIRPVTHERARE